MKFWKDLKPFVKPGLERVTPKQLATTSGWKTRFDTIVITDKVYGKLATKLRKWVARYDGNLVLTDSALQMLTKMKMIDGKASPQTHYLGYVNFATAGRAVTYKDPLAKRINLPGAAEGGAPGPGDTPPSEGDEIHRRQTYEAVPIGYSIQDASGDDANNSPVWTIPQTVFKKARGKQRAVGTTGEQSLVSYGEIRYHGGRIRFIGAVLPMPTAKYDNPFGVGNYGVTYAGYQMLKNLLFWSN